MILDCLKKVLQPSDLTAEEASAAMEEILSGQATPTQTAALLVALVTLANLMLGALLKPTEGSIQLNDLLISDLEEDKLPQIRLQHFGFIFQDFNLLSALTALENVAIVAELAGSKGPAARQKAQRLLTDLGLGGRLSFLPEKLSGGEKQRIAIARALVNDPAVILADEPTANLDSKIGREIMRTLRTVAKEQGRSVVIVSHDERIKEIADRVLWLEDGQFKAISEQPGVQDARAPGG